MITTTTALTTTPSMALIPVEELQRSPSPLATRTDSYTSTEYNLHILAVENERGELFVILARMGIESMAVSPTLTDIPDVPEIFDNVKLHRISADTNGNGDTVRLMRGEVLAPALGCMMQRLVEQYLTQKQAQEDESTTLAIFEEDDEDLL